MQELSRMIRPLIEAAITEVTLTDALRFGVQWNFQAGNANFAQTENAVTADVTRLIPGFSFFYGAQGINATLNAEKKFGARRTTPMPVTGKDVMETLQLYQGKRVGEILAALERAWLNGTWTTRDEGLALAVSKLKSMPTT
jgi:hypothetical protein